MGKKKSKQPQSPIVPVYAEWPCSDTDSKAYDIEIPSTPHMEPKTLDDICRNICDEPPIANDTPVEVVFEDCQPLAENNVLDSFGDVNPQEVLYPSEPEISIDKPLDEYSQWSGPTELKHSCNTCKSIEEKDKEANKSSKLFIVCIHDHAIVVTNTKQTNNIVKKDMPIFRIFSNSLILTVCKDHMFKSTKIPDISMSTNLLKGSTVHKAAEYICKGTVDILEQRNLARCIAFSEIVPMLTKDCGLSSIEYSSKDGKLDVTVLPYLKPGFVY